MRSVWLGAAMGLFLLAAPAGAQDYRARVQGTATDSSQGALPGATVTLLNEATGVAATVTTDEHGRYLPVHRFTTAFTWQVPIGRNRAFLSTLPAALDYAIGGWQYTAAMRYYSGRQLFFGNFVVNGDPTLDEPTRDRWFDTSRFSVQDSFTPRNNPSFYDGLIGPSAFFADMTLTKVFPLGSRSRLEARIEAYNAFNTIVWDNPELNLASSNFGKVTRKRTDGQGREIQIGVRFAF